MKRFWTWVLAVLMFATSTMFLVSAGVWLANGVHSYAAFTAAFGLWSLFAGVVWTRLGAGTWLR